jgi:CheY-like chemotaxis protein
MALGSPARPSPVLVVEDEVLLRLYAGDFLEAAGFEVVDAPHARAALDIMASRPDIRLLFTDIHMPGQISGMELARLVHERWPHVLLLITSGNERPSPAEIADHGHFLAKPYRPEEVIREIHDLTQEANARLSDGRGGGPANART